MSPVRLASLCVLLTALALSVGAQAQLRDGLSVRYGSPPAPPLELEGLEGKQYSLVGLRGRVVVINFWATWCPPCIEEMPALERMWEELNPEGLQVLAVNAGEREERIEEFLLDFEPPLKFPILLDRTSDAFKGWNVMGLPVTYVVDKEGRIIYSAQGGRQMDSEHIIGLLRALMKK